MAVQAAISDFSGLAHKQAGIRPIRRIGPIFCCQPGLSICQGCAKLSYEKKMEFFSRFGGGGPFGRV